MTPKLCAVAVSAALIVPAGAAAAGEDGPPPLRGWSRGMFVAAGGGSVGGLDFGGVGLDLELARGFGRWQVFGEAQAAWASLSRPAPEPSGLVGNVDGLRVRSGVGVRAVVRSMRPDHSAALELIAEAGLGVERFWWDGGGVLTRPDVAVGAGFQIRGFTWPIATIRFGLDVLVAAPVDGASVAAVCRGSCPRTSPGAESQFVTNIGVSW